MLDQSFSASNFRKIFDSENRRGNYLESAFFPEIQTQSRLIQSCIVELRALRNKREFYSAEKYEEKKANLSKEIENLKKNKEQMLISELEAVSAAVRLKSFSFGIKEVDVGKPKKAFAAERNAPTFFALKQIQHNIRHLYKVKQANRHHIVCQLRELLGDNFPKYIIRTDISSFYESIPRKKLLNKLYDDPLLTPTSKKIISRMLFEYGRKTGSDTGVPRGIGISAYLAELYMRDLDSSIRDYLGVLFYARYVDDIFIIYCPPPNVGTWQFRRAVVSALRKKGLTRNRKKTQIIKVESTAHCSIQYLGYKFDIGARSVDLRMTDQKIARYKQRIDISFEAYDKQSNKSEKKARVLLEKRIRFLTGNTRLVNNKKNVVSGIFFSNSLLSSCQDLKVLDAHLRKAVSGMSSVRLKERLSKNSFKYGFKLRKYHKFSAQDLSRIVEVWKHVS